jgi:hypothetical protein
MTRFYIAIQLILLLYLPFQGLGQNSRNPSDISKEDQDSVLVAANPDMKAGSIQKFFIGNNYRKEWTTPVRVRVLRLSSDHGGLKVGKEGGGKQTRSITVDDNNGRSWKLRSIRKYPEGALPEEFKKTIAEKILYDGISASYPYGALSVPVLSNAVKVPYYKVSLTYIPDDDRLGAFREKFRNTLVLMEAREPTIFLPGIKVKEDNLVGTDELVQALMNKNVVVNQAAVLRARLLDNFIMDFDRHEQQWKWFAINSGNKKVYYPVPSDRDQAFYTNQGVIPGIAKGKSIAPELEGFKKKAKNISTFNRPARNFDRYFLTGLTESDWSKEIDNFLAAMTDSVIENAMALQPSELHNKHYDKIIKTLKQKRAYFKNDMIKYYRGLSETITITGTNNSDLFTVLEKENGNLLVRTQRKDSSGAYQLIYERLINPEHTKEIHLYGLEGNDEFIIEENNSPVKIRMVGGPGEDKFSKTGTGEKARAYDVSFEQNELTGRIKNRIHSDPLNNTYTRLGFTHPHSSLIIKLEYSSDGGLFIGPRYESFKNGFRKRPYGQSHYLSATRAVHTSAYHMIYKSEFLQIAPKLDLVLDGDLKLPTVRSRFYGIGNNTTTGNLRSEDRNFLVHYNLGNLAAQFIHRPNNWFTITAGPAFQYFELRDEKNSGKFISTVDPSFEYIPGKNAVLYSGAVARMEIDTRNSRIFPTRGVSFNVSGNHFFNISGDADAYSTAASQFSFYTDVLWKHKLVIASGTGIAHTMGNYLFYQGQKLGFRENLRGYRTERFAGRTRAYNNSEFRYKVADVNLFLVKGPVGILGFNDMGRVWADGETSDKWHQSAGGGIWLIPFNKLAISATLAYSEEEKNFGYIKFGFQF